MSLMKKIVAGATILSVAFMLMGPIGSAKATTVQDLQQQIAQLEAQLKAYQAQLAQLQGTTPTPSSTSASAISGIPAGFKFTRSLKYGMTGDDVKYLQIVLNSDPDTQVATSGAGSPGHETKFFGPKTKVAVIKFQEKYASEVLAKWGLTKGTGFVGSTTRAKLNSLLSAGTTPTPPAAASSYTNEADCTAAHFYWYNNACHETAQAAKPAGLTVALADNTPPSGVVVTGQALADFVHFTFTNGDTKDVKVTQIKVQRLGVSQDSALPYVYLYDGSTRLTDPATLSSGYALFNDPSGLFTVPAGGSKTIAVKADVATGVNGQIIGFGIASKDDIQSDATAINGNFPLNGNQMSVASGTLAGADFSATTDPVSGTVDPGETGFTVWKNMVNVSSRAVYLKYLRLKEIGSIAKNDLQNFNLYVNGVKVAGPVQMDDNYNVVFDLTSNPVTLETGNRALEVRADVIDGSSKTFKFSLWYSSDIALVDSQYSVDITPTISGTTTFIPVNAGQITVNSGSLSVVKASDSPSGSVVKNANNVTLAKYTFTAYGEKIKVTSLKVGFTQPTGKSGSDASTAVTKLRNGKLYADGVQVGSTQDILYSGTTYNLGSALIVEPGHPVTLEVKADIYDNDGTNNLDNNDTLTVSLLAGTDNAQKMTSMELLNAPANDTSGYEVTVATGSLTLVKSSAYADQTTIAGQSAYKIGSYVLTSANENININQFTVGVTAASGAAVTDLSNLYIKYGSNTLTPKSTVSASNPFTLSYTMPAGTQIVIDVYADISSSAAVSGTYTTSLAISGTTAESGTAVSVSAVTGQTITIAEATLTPTVSASTPDAGLVVATNSDVPVATYKFTAKNADILLKDVTLKVVDPTYVSDIKDVKLSVNGQTSPVVYPVLTSYTAGTIASSTAITVATGMGATFSSNDKIVVVDGSNSTVATISSISGDTLTLSAALPTGFATNDSVTIKAYGVAFSGADLTVSKDTPLEVTALVDLNDVTTNGVDGGNVQLALYQYKYNVGGVDHTVFAKSPEYFTGLAANAMTVYNTKPAISGVGIASTALGNGTKELIRFTIAADSHDDVSWKTATFKISLYDSSVASTTDAALNLELSNIKLVNSAGDTISTTATATTTATTKTVTITLNPADSNSFIDTIAKGASAQYRLLADVSGAGTGDSVSSQFTGMTWDDQINNDIPSTYVTGIPTDTMSMSE